MIYGPFAPQFESAQPAALASATGHTDYKYHSVLINGPRVIRWSQAIHPGVAPSIYNPSQPNMLLQAAQERHKHLGMLAELGIGVPTYHSVIGVSPYEPAATVLYDHVEFIEGQPITESTHPRLLQRLGAMLNEYLEQCEQTPDKQYMSDIFDTGQYIISNNCAITLVDIEPLILGLDNTSSYAKSVLDDAHIALEYYAHGKIW